MKLDFESKKELLEQISRVQKIVLKDFNMGKVDPALTEEFMSTLNEVVRRLIPPGCALCPKCSTLFPCDLMKSNPHICK